MGHIFANVQHGLGIRVDILPFDHGDRVPRGGKQFRQGPVPHHIADVFEAVDLHAGVEDRPGVLDVP